MLYREDGFQDQIEGELRTRVWNNLVKQKPVKMADTYDPADNTYAYYLSLPLWDIEMRSQSRIRLDIIFDTWEKTRLIDLLGQAPQHKITAKDWSFGPHSIAKGDPVDFPGVAEGSKDDIDARYWETPINQYICVYRKGEYIWGYSPSMAELKTKKTHYTLQSQVTAPLHNPSEDFVAINRTVRSIDVSGWAIVEPVEGTLNDIWVNGVKQKNIEALYTFDKASNRYNFTIPVPVQNGRNNVDLTLFAGPKDCDSCYGCANSNHSFYVEFQGAKQYPSMLVLRDPADQPINDTIKLDTTTFHVIVTDRNGNIKDDVKDNVKVKIKNLDSNDSTTVILLESDVASGIFKTNVPVAVVDKTPAQSGDREIAMNGGDRVRIWYVDASDSTDSSEAFIYSKASFPIAKRGFLRDANGDGSVDLFTVEYSIPLKQNPDSLSVAFPSSAVNYKLKVTTDGMTFAGNVLTIIPATPFANGITGFTSAMYSTGTSFLTNAGFVKSSNFQVYDSIGPVLNGEALARERLAPGNDTVEVTISEGYKVAHIEGDLLQLKKAGVNYPLTIVAVLTIVPGTNRLVLLVDAKGQSLAGGDSLFLNSASPFTDMQGNHPHPGNRRVPVVVKASLPKIAAAWYKDIDANGQIDNVVLQFSKPVQLTNTTISLRWNSGSYGTVPADSLQQLSPAEIVIRTGPSLTANEIVTGGNLQVIALYANTPKDTSLLVVADSAAPVIGGATFILSTVQMSDLRYIDTLDIVFSEPIDPASAQAIVLYALHSTVGGVDYSFTATQAMQVAQNKFRYYGYVTGVEYPNSGDLIWLPPSASLTDTKNNIQKSANNRRAPVTVADFHLSLKNVKIESGPNPFSPEMREVFMVKIEPVSRFPMQLDSSARTIIYDKVGNLIAKPMPVKKIKGVEILWDGTNNKGRFVGSGTYLMILYFKGEQQRILIGVDNSR